MILVSGNTVEYYDQDDKEPAACYKDLDSKIENITTSLDKAWCKNLRNQMSVGNADTICNYIIDMKTEINPTTNYITDSISLPYLLSRYLKNKPFKEVTRQNIIDFLDSLRKPETLDPMHK
jgi:hypothetical protein